MQVARPSRARAPAGRDAAGWSGDTARRAIALLRLASATVTPVVASVVMLHTLTSMLQHHPALPIADGWAPWTSLRQVLDGRTTPVQALVARHNEHRILLTRALFLLDLLDGGR